MNEKIRKYVFCIRCGEKNNVGARFCQSCGASLEDVEKEQTEEVYKERQHWQSAYAERKQEFAGKIIKCPNCGEILKAFITECPSCGYELRCADSNNTLKELVARLDAIDLRPDVVSQEKHKKNSELNVLTEKDKRKIDLIRNFPIPNTKEDLYEFLIMAASNVDTEHIEGWNASGQSKGEKALSEAWKAKYEQAYLKATISFGNLQEFQELNEAYLDKIQQYERKKSIFNKIFIVFFTAFMLLGFISFSFMIKEDATRQKAIDAENERLEIILNDIQKCIEEGNYTKALSLNATLYFNISENFTSAVKAKEHWDDVRKELYDVIENAKENEFGTIEENDKNSETQ